MTDVLKNCRSCQNERLEIVLRLGQTPLANSLLSAKDLDQTEITYALDLAFCPECSLVQITETVPPEILFREYLYFSSFSDELLRHARELTEKVCRKRRLDADSLVLEIASNDGYLLQNYKQAGIPVLGIEPAVNIARAAREERGIPTLEEFFGLSLAQELNRKGQRADVIHANNVLAHVADLNGFVRGIQLVLKDNGIAVIEVPYVKDMIDRSEFDTIYHEHLCYFSLTALEQLFSRHGLVIEDVERIDIHGGSLRIFARRQDAIDKETFDRRAVSEMLREEASWGVNDVSFYQGFGAKVEKLRENLTALLRDLKAQGKRIAVYGASAKGSTLLNYFNIGKETLEFVADRSTVKQGRYTPGTHLPICAPEQLLKAMPDYVLLLTWNFVDEILSQQNEFRERGGRFIVPIPELRVV